MVSGNHHPHLLGDEQPGPLLGGSGGLLPAAHGQVGYGHHQQPRPPHERRHPPNVTPPEFPNNDTDTGLDGVCWLVEVEVSSQRESGDRSINQNDELARSDVWQKFMSFL